MPRDGIVACRLVCEEFMLGLPEEIRAQLRGVRLAVMEKPTPELLADGVEAEEAGAFIQLGEDVMPLGDGMTDEKPQRTIYIFTQNLRPFDRATVESVLLHEIGHACGMDEAEVAAAVGVSA